MADINQSPLVSVVLATYNGATFLAHQLDSIFAQTYSNIEVIAVDDCSADNTVAILNSYAATHTNMKVFVNEHNLGYIKNFEKACGLSNGEFIALCDQDDEWDKDKIKIMVEAIGEHPMAFCDSIVCDEHLNDTGKRISSFVNCRSRYNCLEMSVFCRIYGNATLFRKSMLSSAVPFLEIIPHDWWLSYVATLHGGIKYIDQPLVYYRQHSANVFGAIGGKSRTQTKASKRQKKKEEIIKIRKRITTFYEICPDELTKEKKVLALLQKSYQSFSLPNNILRMTTFFRYQKILLFVKKRSALRKFFFCFKMFAIIK